MPAAASGRYTVQMAGFLRAGGLGAVAAGQLRLVGGFEKFAGLLWSASWSHASDAPRRKSTISGVFLLRPRTNFGRDNNFLRGEAQ